VLERPDGYYWRYAEGDVEVGPFHSRAEAEQDLLANSDEDADAEMCCEDWHQAAEVIGVSDWIDPDTGQPAEEWVHRLED
jgi:hypothetical protein